VYQHISCTDPANSLDFIDGTAEFLSFDRDDFVVTACDYTVNEMRERIGRSSAEGWDVFFEYAYVCRVLTKTEARQIVRFLQEDPGLLVVFQVHES